MVNNGWHISGFISIEGIGTFLNFEKEDGKDGV